MTTSNRRPSTSTVTVAVPVCVPSPPVASAGPPAIDGRLERIVVELSIEILRGMFPGDEGIVVEHQPVERNRRVYALDVEVFERPLRAFEAVIAVVSSNDQLRDHRVVVAADLVALRNRMVEADADTRRWPVGGQPTGRGREVGGGFSALIRYSIAWPAISTSSWSNVSSSPAATRSCHRTISMPVTSSLTVCST